MIRRYGSGNVVGEQPEAGDARGPAPVGGLELEEVDLERVAGLGADDRDRAVDLVDPLEVEPGEVVDRRGRRSAGRRDASSRSNSTTTPLSTVSIGAIAGSQARWKRSREMWIAGVVCIGRSSASSERCDCAAAPSRIGSPWPTSSVSKRNAPSFVHEAFASAASSVKSGSEPPRVPPVVRSASPATSSPPTSSSTATCPSVCPGVATMRSPNTESPSATGVSGFAAVIFGMSSAPA